MFCYCQQCRRFYNDKRAHNCPAPPPPPKPLWTWRKPWHVTTAADTKIARKFRNCRTAAMF